MAPSGLAAEPVLACRPMANSCRVLAPLPGLKPDVDEKPPVVVAAPVEGVADVGSRLLLAPPAAASTLLVLGAALAGDGAG